MFIRRISGALLLVAALAGCSDQPDPTDAAASGDRGAALHTAAECLRQHGVKNFADPVLGADGQVFTDARPMENAGDDVLAAATNACRDALGAANWNPDQQPPAPAALVEAGVKAAQCFRSHGLPNYKDPTANSRYTPGHGFSIQEGDLPAGADKRTPAVQQAFDACHELIDAETHASQLDQLAGK